MSTLNPKPLRVLIVQPVVPHYRLKLYQLLYQRLQQDHITLKVIYGTPNQTQAAKRDLVNLPAPIGLKVKNYWFFNGKILYQPILRQMLSADLVILLNANGYIMNYLIAATVWLWRPRLGFWVWWPHSRTNQASIGERIRQQMMRTGQWWFAYTAGIQDYLIQDGISKQQITVLHNSVDLAGFKTALTALSDTEVQDFAAFLGIPFGAPIALFCGGLYEDKRLGFLLEAVTLIQTELAEFHVLILGDGPKRDLVLQVAANNNRVHYLGPCFAKEKALCFRLAKLFLCPGLVGLAILDAFAAGLPLITTDNSLHSPEIEYLNHGENGLMLADDLTSYANAVVMLLQTQSEWQRLSDGALISAQHYSIENMVEHFAEGIMACLKTA